MLLDQIPYRFKNLSRNRDLKYSLGNVASESCIVETELRLGLSFPKQVRSFYQHYNGLRVDDPWLEILSLEQMRQSASNLLHFATVDHTQLLYFDTSKMNEADQWDIVTADGFRVTLSMASFWSNRMWAWIDKRRAIWREEPNITECK